MSVRDRIRGISLPRPKPALGERVTMLRARLAAIGWAPIVAAVLALIYLGWVVYTAAHGGVDRGVGALVAWPSLVLLVAVVAAPFVGVGVLIRRLISTRH